MMKGLIHLENTIVMTIYHEDECSIFTQNVCEAKADQMENKETHRLKVLGGDF